MRPFARFIAVAALAVMLTGAAPAKRTTTVAIDGVRFQPGDVTVTVGDTVVWTNKDPFPHNVSAAGGAFQSASLAPGRSFRFHAAKAGTFPYTCTLHPTMKGEIHVKEH